MNTTCEFEVDDAIRYNDGRPGHTNIYGVIKEVHPAGMVVWFEDRADTTFIRFTDRAWMDFIVKDRRRLARPNPQTRRAPAALSQATRGP